MNFRRRKDIVLVALIAAAAGIGVAVFAALRALGWYVVLAGALFALNAALLAMAASEKSFRPGGEKRFDFFAFMANHGVLANLFLWIAAVLLALYLRGGNPLFSYAMYILPAALLLLIPSIRAGFRLGKFQKTRNTWDRFDYEQQRAAGETRQIYHCPRCGQIVYEDQEQCENCGNIFVKDKKNRK